MTHCSRCHILLKRATGGGGLSADMPDGTVVLWCSHCRLAAIEGYDQWVPPGEGFVPSLRILATKVKQARDTQKAIMESPIEDPRWESVA